jgi:hypothetical protein
MLYGLYVPESYAPSDDKQVNIGIGGTCFLSAQYYRGVHTAITVVLFLCKDVCTVFRD